VKHRFETPLKGAPRKGTMRAFFALMLAIIAIVSFSALPVSADSRSDCFATCRGLAPAERPACFRGCPPAGATPKAPPHRAQPGRHKPRTFSCPEGQEKVEGKCLPLCGENSARDAETHECVCADGFTRPPSTCIPVCKWSEGELRQEDYSCLTPPFSCKKGEVETTDGCKTLEVACSALASEARKSAEGKGCPWWACLLAALAGLLLGFLFGRRGKKKGSPPSNKGDALGGPPRPQISDGEAPTEI